MFARICHYFALRPYWFALFITAGLIAWMLLQPVQQSVEESNTAINQKILPKVQITRFTPQKINKYLTLYGRSEANSHAMIRAEIAGKIDKIVVEKGRYVKANSLLVRIEKNALPERLAQAEGLLAERLLNYKAVKSLNDKGLQGRARLAEMNSLLLAAKTDLKKLQLELQRTDILAPVAGILQEQFAEKGDFLQVGDAIFSLENIDPIIIRGDTTEHAIEHLRLGQTVSATLLSGESIEGKISYIASHSDSKSSTFRVEAEFANPQFTILSGFAAKLTIPLYPIEAIYISPSALAVDAQGNLGVKLVENGRVVFKKISLVEADNDGVWLSGFTDPVDIITLGQGFVNPGDSVQAIAVER